MNNNNSFTNNNNNDQSFEQEILESRGVSNVEDDDVQMINPKMGRRKNYVDKLNRLSPKNFKMRRTIIAIICIAVISVSFIISASFAKMTNTSETSSASKLEAGTMKLEFSKGSSAINLVNALPQLENDAILNNPEYLFTVSNTGNITAQYSIILDNTCSKNKTYKVNKKEIKPDVCIPNKYIKIGISVNDSDYRIIPYDEASNTYLIDTKLLNSGATNKYKMKLWLALETPNDYNSKNGKQVFYAGNINIIYKQVEEMPASSSSLDSDI